MTLSFSTPDTIIALFNYGGGIRGMIPAQVMMRIEEKTGLRMAQMVDIFCGPSTGAILNAALNVPDPDKPDTPRFRARHMVRFYEQEGARIFPPDRFRDFRALLHDFNNRTMKIRQLRNLFRHGHYNPGSLYSAMHALYGDLKLSDSLSNLVIPVFSLNGEQLEPVQEQGESDEAPVHTRHTFVDQGGYALWLKKMRTGRSDEPIPDVLLRDAVMASAAAPSYFPSHPFTLRHGASERSYSYSGIDGSIFDNPCISYHGAIRRHIPRGKKLIMIMLGTGHSLRSFEQADWDSYGGLGIVDPANNLPLINILFHASETALVESFRAEMKDNLFVFNKSILRGSVERLPSFQIDDAQPENLTRMKRFVEDMLEEQKPQFETLCDLLVRNYERRQRKKSLWRLFR